jgi:hypothetical protein
MNMELQRICMERHATAFLVTHSIPEAVILSRPHLVMQPHPGRIVEVVDIDLPRPRTLDMINTPLRRLVAHPRPPRQGGLPMMPTASSSRSRRPDRGHHLGRARRLDRPHPAPRGDAACAVAVFLAIWGWRRASASSRRSSCRRPAETWTDLIFVGQNMIAGGYMREALWITTTRGPLRLHHRHRIGFSLGVIWSARPSSASAR